METDKKDLEDATDDNEDDDIDNSIQEIFLGQQNWLPTKIASGYLNLLYKGEWGGGATDKERLRFGRIETLFNM